MEAVTHFKPVVVPAVGKPKIIVIAHFHLCGSCGKLRVCNDLPCWLGTVLLRTWTCPRCSSGPNQPAIALSATA